MGFREEVSEKVEESIGLMRKCFGEALSGLEDKEKHLNAVQESVTQSCEELDAMRQAIEARAKEVEETERLCRVYLEEGLNELEVKRKELCLIREDIIVREGKLNEKEKVIKGLFEKVESERKQFETIRNSVNEVFQEICLQEKQVEDRLRELDVVNNELERRASEEPDEGVEKMKSSVKDIQLGDEALGSEKRIFEASGSELDARGNQLDSVRKSKELCSKEPDSTIPTPSHERTKKRRKREEKAACENDAEQHAVIDLNGSDSGSECDLNESSSATESDSACSDSVHDHGEAGMDLTVSDSDDSSGSEDSEPIDRANSLFNNFGTYTLRGFRVGQMWACSHNSSNDNMPKSYARVIKVRNNIVRVAWLQPVAHYPGPRMYRRTTKNVDLPVIEQGWNEWIDAGLPVGCGGFISGKEEAVSLSCCNFSHQVCYKSDFTPWGIVCPYLIYPSKGEIWALYKDWDISKWASNPENHRRCKYQIVEIVERNSFDTRIAYLNKLGGFASLFKRRSDNEKHTILIDDTQLFRFSHKVPSVKMSGYTREGVPEGSFELDPKFLPASR